MGVVLGLAVSLPSAPGFIGIYQSAVVLVFALFLDREDIAIAYAIVTHLIIYVFVILYGTYALVSQGMSLGSLYRARLQQN